jgi:hypothetical protein
MAIRPLAALREVWGEPGTKVGAVLVVGAVVAAGGGLAFAADRPASHPAAVPAAQTAAGDPEVFVAVTPTRVLDTRPGTDGPIGVAAAGPLGAGDELDLPLTTPAPNRPSAPLPSNAAAAVLNITIDQDAPIKSFLTVWPTGTPRPSTSANNAEPGLVSPNLTIARLGNGSVSFYNQQGATNIAADLVGYTIKLSDALPLANAQSGLAPQSFGQAGSPVNLDATFRPVATFTPTEGGTYVLDGSVSVTKTALLNVATNPTLACKWTAGGSDAGPTFSVSLVASASVLGVGVLDLGSSTEANALGQATLAAGQPAELQCNASAPTALTLGAVQTTAAAFTATKAG